VRNSHNQMVPMRSIANARIVVGPQVISRYNNYRRSPCAGGRPQRLLGRCVDRVAQASATSLPPGYA